MGVKQLSTVISSEITSKFSLQIPCKQINTLKELLDTKMSLIIFPTFPALNKIYDKNDLEKILKKVEQENTIVDIGEMIHDKKYVVDVSKGGSAIFVGKTVLKVLVNSHSQHFGQNIKFRFIDEHFRNPFLFTIASNTRLPKGFRVKLNSR